MIGPTTASDSSLAKSEIEGGAEWAFWHQPSDSPVRVAAVRDRLEPDDKRVAAALRLLKGWLID